VGSRDAPFIRFPSWPSVDAFGCARREGIALLIGNQNYDSSVGRLNSPHNDVGVVGQALAAQGFELIPPIKDSRRSAILGGVRELVGRLNGAGSGSIGFIYYSGHGAAEKDTKHQLPDPDRCERTRHHHLPTS
jgi:Caspase domain